MNPHLCIWKSEFILIHFNSFSFTGNDDNKDIVYVKGFKKREWLADILNSDLTIESLDANYEDTDSLRNLDIINTVRCERHVKNWALQNVFKIYY